MPINSTDALSNSPQISPEISPHNTKSYREVQVNDNLHSRLTQSLSNNLFNSDINAKVDIFSNWDENGNWLDQPLPIYIGTTALGFAAYNGNLDEIKNLLAIENIDINAKDNSGNSALCIAAFHDQYDIVKLLLTKNTIDITELAKQAAGNGWTDIIPLLIASENTNINAPLDEDMDTMLSFAATYGQHEIVKQLLANENIEVNKLNKYGFTALICAIYPLEGGYTDARKQTVIELLKHKDLDININNNESYHTSYGGKA